MRFLRQAKRWRRTAADRTPVPRGDGAAVARVARYAGRNGAGILEIPTVAFPQRHRLSVCHEDAKAGVIFVNIPKNASSSIKGWCNRNGFKRTERFRGTEAPSRYRVFCVLRDPVERFLSGALWYWRTLAKKQDDEDPTEQVVLDAARRTVDAVKNRESLVLDCHTTPQFVFLTHLPRVTHFLQYESLESDLARFVGEVGTYADCSLVRAKETPKNTATAFRQQFNEDDILYIADYYYEDVLLYLNAFSGAR